MNRLLSTFGFTRPPFSKDISPSEMFQTDQFQEAMLGLKAAIEGRTSAVVTGDSGSGKTCLIRALEQDLPQGRYRLHYTANATVNRRDFYRQISIGMGLEAHSSFAALYSTVLLNFEKDSKPWLSLILVGLPDLRETLRRNLLASLAARIPIRLQLSPLDAEQVKLYVRHRMNAAGCRHDIFSDDALLLMSKATGGILRRVDVLGDHCLAIAMKTKAGVIDATVVQKALQSCGEAL